MTSKKTVQGVVSLLVVLMLIVPLVSGCTLWESTESESPQTATDIKQFDQNLPFAETVFYLNIPEAVSEEMVFELLDDVTGIDLNPTRYAMEQISETQFSLRLPVKLGSLIKYRYYRNASLPIYETNYQNKNIQYRVAYIDKAAYITDQITNWSDLQYQYNYGRIEGQILNSTNNSPLPNLFVTAGGLHTFTNSLGKFTLEGLPAGKHNLVTLSTDGEYQVFQQEAVIADGLTTPADVRVKPSDFVNVTFLVYPPADHPQEATIRMLGSSYQLSNIFGVTESGASTIAARAPKLTSLPDGSTTVTLSLPEGADLRYKYSLGDGFWNAELKQDGTFNIRQLIVPNKDMTVVDKIDSWKSSESAPISFIVNVPDNTPDSDSVSIQFNPFGWTNPLPMWKSGENSWSYILYGPFNMIGAFSYRYCRNDNCNIADDSNSMGKNASGYSLTPGLTPQTINDDVLKWALWQPATEPTTLVAPAINNRGNEFVTGIEFISGYSPSAPLFIDGAYQNLLDISANTVLIPVEWTLESFNPIVFSQKPGINPLWKDLVLMIQKAQMQGLKVWLTPVVEVSDLAMKQWLDDNKQDAWQTIFQKEFLDYLLYTADLAAYMNVEKVVLSTDILNLSTFSDYPSLKELIVNQLVEDVPVVKQHFLNGVFVYSNLLDIEDIKKFGNSVDGYVIKFDGNLNVQSQDIEAFSLAFKEKFDTVLYPVSQNTEKPVFVSIDYPSATGAETGCVAYGEDCIDGDLLNQLASDVQSSLSIDMQLQVDLYQALLSAVNETNWIHGVISSGFNYHVALHNPGSSVRGKPAADVLWYWYPRLNGSIQ
ncbi:MAG: hypothetical protein CVU39_03015 [Chloroflexi bacterium HGW-Chloroflexi-10]|nr:MAG: hypothetical protein CVU39_03015 [Chloroflexi bacterium HGW-Chloroflexi-10]